MAEFRCAANPYGCRGKQHSNVDLCLNVAEHSGTNCGVVDHNDHSADNYPSCFAYYGHASIATWSDDDHDDHDDHDERHNHNETGFGTRVSRQDYDHHNRRCTFESPYDHVVLQDHWW
jgi:hypothetical protein